MNSKTVQQIKREAVQNFKNVSAESDDDGVAPTDTVQSTSLELKFEVEEVRNNC